MTSIKNWETFGDNGTQTR